MCARSWVHLPELLFDVPRSIRLPFKKGAKEEGKESNRAPTGSPEKKTYILIDWAKITCRKNPKPLVAKRCAHRILVNGRARDSRKEWIQVQKGKYGNYNESN